LRSRCIGKIAALQSDFPRGLLAENQHPLPEKLLNPTRKAGDEWQTGARETATADLASAMKVARELSYL